MWIDVKGEGHLVNLDHVMEIKVTIGHGKSALQAILPNGETLIIREYHAPKEAASTLDQITEVLKPNVYSV